MTSILDAADALANACLGLGRTNDANEASHVLLYEIAPALGAYIKKRREFEAFLHSADDVLDELKRLEKGEPVSRRGEEAQRDASRN